MVKKQMIMENALELFAKQGFEATSIQQITEKCGISKGAFYLSFKSKDELILSLLDQFLEEMLTKYEQLVTNTNSDDQLLYKYCYISFENVKKNIDLACIFIKDANTTFNAFILKKLESFYSIMNQLLHTLVKRQYPNAPEHLQAEIVFLMHTFTKSYTELLLHPTKKMDIVLMCRSIEEKIMILANSMTICTFQSLEQLNIFLSKEQLIALMNEKIEKIESSITLETLQLLRDDLVNPSLNNAIKHGLIKNLHADIQTKTVAYLYELYS